ncbi:MAG: TrkH family potassium uptake protein [Actinobacteria bacterium]|nr:TrkH family potassium uptake protein [Actinomycetota bacterium]
MSNARFLPVRKTAIRRATELSFGRAKIESTTLHVMGIAVAAISFGMFVGALVEWGSTNRDTAALLISGTIALGAGSLLWWVTVPGTVRARDVFSAVGWTWLVVTLVGAVPYLLGGTFDVPGIDRSGQFVNAIFESASGYSCTGSTALTDFVHPGRGMMMYRQITQWYGGMGIVVLAVAVLPFLGVGGLDLMSAEAPGPSGDRLTPRVSETAKRLWATYVLFTLAVAVTLVIIPGPSLYDGVAHGLTTASTGGFSPHADSIGAFDSLAVEIALIAGMVVGGTRLDGGFSFDSAARAGVFNVVALGTSTGFGSAQGGGSPGDFVLWVPAAQMVILLLMVVGASTGSTSGGIKVMRVQVLLSHSIRAIRRSRHPHAVIPVKHGRRAVREDIVSRMAGFFLVYLLLVLAGIVILTALGGGFVESIGATVGALGNMGPALGSAGPTANFTEAFTEPGRLVLALYMLIGRLEIFPILLMFAAPLRTVRDRLS